MQNFAAIGPFGAEIWRGGQIDPPPPPPSKNLLSKSPVKIGLKDVLHQKICAIGKEIVLPYVPVSKESP